MCLCLRVSLHIRKSLVVFLHIRMNLVCMIVRMDVRSRFVMQVDGDFGLPAVCQRTFPLCDHDEYHRCKGGRGAQEQTRSKLCKALGKIDSLPSSEPM